MKNADALQPPEESPGDTAHLVASAILSIIPGAAELFRWFVIPPLEKRQRAWAEVVSSVLRRLESQFSLKLEDLQRNEGFVSLVTQATLVALKTHQKAKRTALRNALLNAASAPSSDEDLPLAFVRFIDELSPAHLTLLRNLSSRQSEVDKVKTYENLYALLVSSLPGSPSRDLFKMICLDLHTRGLITISPDIGEFEGIYEASALLVEDTRNDLPRVVVTDIGRLFMAFVSEPV